MFAHFFPSVVLLDARRWHFASFGFEDQSTVGHVGHHGLAVTDIACQNLARERCFHFTLNGPLQWTRAVTRLVASFHQMRDCGIRQFELDLPFGHLPVRRLETKFSTIRPEPVTYWTVVGDQLTLSVFDKRVAEIGHGLRGEIVDGMLVRVSSIGSDTAAAFALQDQFIRDLLTGLRPADRMRLAALP